MTYRLCVLDSEGVRHAMEYDDYPSVLQAMMGQVPWHDEPRVVTVHRLLPWKAGTWSQVCEGDEVLAPNNTTWCVEETAATPGGTTVYKIRNVLDNTETSTTPQPQTEVRRRPGPAADARQMLLDAGIATTFVR